MKRFKTKNTKNKKWIIYFGIFLISVAFSSKYLYQKNLVEDGTFLNILISLCMKNLSTIKTS